MDKAEELAIIRRAFAKQTLAAANVADPRLEQAYAGVRREDFLGPGPWVVPRTPGGYLTTPSDDPVYIYIDNVVQIIAERHLNNGQPSGHAKWMASASIGPRDHVVHVGTGTGYYTAIMSLLVGPEGRVTGIEFDGGLGERAKKNLAAFSNVCIVQGDGATVPFDAADVIYVNAGITRPADHWLDNLKDGGRLLVSLTTKESFAAAEVRVPGAVFVIQRQADEYRARYVGPVFIIPCESARDEESEAALAQALKKRGRQQVTRLYRNGDIAEERCWLRAPDWCLAYS